MMRDRGQGLWLISVAAVATLGLLLGSCGEDLGSKPSSATAQVYWPSKDMADDGKDGTWGGMELDGKEVSGAGTWENRFLLNFEGATVKKEDSFIIEKTGEAEITIPAFQPVDLGAKTFASTDRAAMIEEIMELLKTHFVGLNVEFSTDAATFGDKPYSTVYIGGTNFTGRPNVLGVSPLDIGNFSGQDRIFVFPQEFKADDKQENLVLLVQTMDHEMAHSLGARHIEAEAAIMRPIVSVDASKFDETGTVVGGTDTENTLEVLKMAIGTRSDEALDTTPPEIKELAAISEGEIAQYSVFSIENFKANPKRNLNDFKYTWEFRSYTAEGPSFRIRFRDEKSYDLKLTAVHKTTGESKSYMFKVGRIPAP